jgi:hypothetical protein
LQQTRHNGDDLAALRTRLDRVEGKLDGVSQKVDGLQQDVGSLKATVDGLVRNLPTIVSEAVRTALRNAAASGKSRNPSQSGGPPQFSRKCVLALYL